MKTDSIVVLSRGGPSDVSRNEPAMTQVSKTHEADCKISRLLSVPSGPVIERTYK